MSTGKDMTSKKKNKTVAFKEEIEDVKFENGAEYEGYGIAASDDELEPEWSEADRLELLRKIESNIPEKDTLRHDSRVEKLNWDAIAFGPYSGAQCKKMWCHIQKRLRRYRLLRELLEDAKDWVSKPWTNFYRSQKQNRHPDLPKRPLSTYMLYYMEKKDEVAKQNPGMEMTNVSRLISVMYNNLSEKKKQKYSALAAAQRAEYEQKLKQFYEDHPELVPKATHPRENKHTIQSEGPKKPSTPFKLFLASKLSKHKNDDDVDRVALTNKYKKQWQELSNKKKVVWINWALEEESRYREQLQVYMSENPDFVPSQFKSVLTKDERNLLERVAGKPDKPPNSGYSLFSRIMLVSPVIKKVPPKERMTEISRLWKSLSDEEKAEYQEKVNHMLEQYKLEYATYLESLSEDKRQEELQSNQPKRKASETSKKSIKKKKSKDEPDSKSSVMTGEPEPPPADPFKLFARLLKANAKKENKTIHDADIVQAWQNLPDSGKAKFRKQLGDMQEKYAEDFEKFLKSLSQEDLKKYSLRNRQRQTQEIPDKPDSSSEDSSDDDSDSDSSSSSSSDSDDSSSENGDGNASSSSSSADSD